MRGPISISFELILRCPGGFVVSAAARAGLRIDISPLYAAVLALLAAQREMDQSGEIGVY